MCPIKVLSVCTSDTSGGAARAAYRIHQGVNALNEDVCSSMFVKNKQSADPTVYALDEFSPKNQWYKAYEWILNKFKNKLQHYRWNKYPDRERIFI